MADLKPCPFCGYEYPTIKHNIMTNTYFVHCEGCQSDHRLDCTAGYYASKEKTIDAWNTRANEKGDSE